MPPRNAKSNPIPPLAGGLCRWRCHGEKKRAQWIGCGQSPQNAPQCVPHQRGSCPPCKAPPALPRPCAQPPRAGAPPGALLRKIKRFEAALIARNP